jgi:hypothetical protein
MRNRADLLPAYGLHPCSVRVQSVAKLCCRPDSSAPSAFHPNAQHMRLKLAARSVTMPGVTIRMNTFPRSLPQQSRPRSICASTIPQSAIRNPTSRLRWPKPPGGVLAIFEHSSMNASIRHIHRRGRNSAARGLPPPMRAEPKPGAPRNRPGDERDDRMMSFRDSVVRRTQGRAESPQGRPEKSAEAAAPLDAPRRGLDLSNRHGRRSGALGLQVLPAAPVPGTYLSPSFPQIAKSPQREITTKWGLAPENGCQAPRREIKPNCWGIMPQVTYCIAR